MRTNLSKLAGRALFFFTFLSGFQAFSNPVNYYFSTALGDDSRTATQAQNPSTPWKTLSKLNSFFANLKPGDSVLFRRGEQYPGSITISASGTSSSPIVIGAYGSGAKPIITGLVALSGWTSLGGGIYESSANTALSSVVNMVLLNDTVNAMGRYPNANAPNKGYLYYQSHSGSTSITSNQISGIPNFVGAELVLRIHRSYTDRCPITAQTSTTISYTKQSGSTPTDGFGFFFQNSIKTLDQLGEWYYNSGTKKTDIYFGGNSPSSYTVKISAIDTLLKAKNVSYITITNISFQGANQIAVAVNGGSNFILQSCDILYSGRDAITIAGTSKFKTDGCFINYSNSRGFNGFQSNVSGPTIINSTVKNTGVFPGMGWKKASDGVMVGIEVTTPGSLVQNNSIINSGYHAVRFYGNNTIVKNNYIDTFCFNKDDGGGIYTYVGSANTTLTGMKLQGNIVLNGIGATAGSNSTNSDALGIYLDDNSNGIEISNNTVGNCYRGIFLHNARNLAITGNTFYNNEHQVRTTHDNMGSAITNCIFKNNIIFSKTSSQTVLYIYSTSNDISAIGTFDSNYYCRPILEPNNVKTSSSSAGGVIRVTIPGTTYYSLDTWKSSYAKDPNSRKTATSVTDTNKIDFKYNTTNTSKTVSLAQTCVGVDGKSYSDSITLAPYSSLILIKNSTGSLNASSNNSAQEHFSIKNFTIKAQPNPSAYYFNLLTQSNNNQPLIVRIIDLKGRILETKNGIDANGTFQFGHNLKPGVYIIEVIQGKEKVQLKVIKI